MVKVEFRNRVGQNQNDGNCLVELRWRVGSRLTVNIQGDYVVDIQG